ncbi:leucine-rich repeat and calponin homology domain-containing protein 1-like, partial [Saccoglossus kowalevskii]
MAAQTQNFKSGTQSQLSRSIERVFDDAEVSCQINLSGRKLKDYPMIANKFDLADTEEIDLSKNRLSELPKDVCQYLWLEKINCYSNVIKNIPDDIIKLRVLIHLNL